MKISDLGELAVRNLREALLRNSLTTLGIGVGVASLVAMLSLGVGLQNLATERLSRSGLFDAIFVNSRGQGFGRGGGENPQPIPTGTLQPLDDDARHKIEALPNVVEVYPEVRFPTEIQFEGNSFSTIVAGVAASARTDGSFDGIKGAFFSGPAADETILQIEFARQLSPQTDSLLGKEITLRYAERQPLPAAESGGDFDAQSGGGFSVIPREEKLRIVGIVETEPAAGFGGLGRGRLLIPLQLAEKLRATQTNDLRQLLRSVTGNGRNYDNLTVRVQDASNVKVVEDSIKQMGFGAFSLFDASRSLGLIFAVFDLLLGIFGSLALVVASLGIINTLVMAILERRREIGILKALGAADRDIRRLFFIEAGAMGLLGGFFGVALGWLIGRAMNFGTNLYLSHRALPPISVASVPWWMIGTAIAFSIAVSLAAGIYPAARAARLNPVEALRYE